MINYFQKGFNYSEDGPGNRMVIHLQGCNIRCPWCSNPEGLEIIDKNLISIDELCDEILSARRLFFDGGGVTFTGGECLLQKKELTLLFKKLKENGINIVIETNSTIKLDSDLFKLIDLIICDFKHYDSIKLKEVLNCSIDEKEIIRSYVDSGNKVRIRTVLVNGFNSTEEDANGYLNFIKTLNTENVEFEFLNYHEYGKAKYERLGLKYLVKNGFVLEEIRQMYEKKYIENGLKVIRS